MLPSARLRGFLSSVETVNLSGRNSSSFLALCESASFDEFLLQLATGQPSRFILLQHAARPAILEAGRTEILRVWACLVNCLVYLLLNSSSKSLMSPSWSLPSSVFFPQSFRDGAHQSAHHLLHGLLWYHADHLAGDCVVAIISRLALIIFVGVALLGGVLVLSDARPRRVAFRGRRRAVCSSSGSPPPPGRC